MSSTRLQLQITMYFLRIYRLTKHRLQFYFESKVFFEVDQILVWHSQIHFTTVSWIIPEFDQQLLESAAAEVFATMQIWFIIKVAELLRLMNLNLTNFFDHPKIFINIELYSASFQTKGWLICSNSLRHLIDIIYEGLSRIKLPIIRSTSSLLYW
jgi:hypothetical protein